MLAVGRGIRVRSVASSGAESLHRIANSHVLSLVCLIQMKMQSAARFRPCLNRIAAPGLLPLLLWILRRIAF